MWARYTTALRSHRVLLGLQAMVRQRLVTSLGQERVQASRPGPVAHARTVDRALWATHPVALPAAPHLVAAGHSLVRGTGAWASLTWERELCRTWHMCQQTRLSPGFLQDGLAAQDGLRACLEVKMLAMGMTEKGSLYTCAPPHPSPCRGRLGLGRGAHCTGATCRPQACRPPCCLSWGTGAGSPRP